MAEFKNDAPAAHSILLNARRADLVAEASVVRGYDFDGGVVPLVRRGGGVVDIHEGVGGSGRGKRLHPIGVAHLSIHILMDEDLSADGSSEIGRASCRERV